MSFFKPVPSSFTSNTCQRRSVSTIENIKRSASQCSFKSGTEEPLVGLKIVRVLTFPRKLDNSAISALKPPREAEVWLDQLLF